MKSLLLLALLASPLSSCFTYKSLTKKEPITHDFLSKLEPERRYRFDLKTGETLIIHILTIKGENITRYVYRHSKSKMNKSDYSDTFQNIEANVAKISVLKFNPYLLTVCIAVPVGLAIWGVSSMANDVVPW